jgi:hypothetical protein
LRNGSRTFWELHEPGELLAVRLDERVLPLARVEDLVAREVERLDLLLARAQAQLHLAAGVRSLGALFVDGDDRPLQCLRAVERLLDVEVVVELELPLLRVTRRDGRVELSGLA